jgi:glycosyltransferase involved in cell wall biosynthesis
MPTKKTPNLGITGYLQMYNDWSRLEVSLRSLAQHLDEIVVVDGAYDWMKEYVLGIGWDPEKSQKEVYDILDKVGIPYRVIQRTWSNELEKRIAGYDACKSRYALRIDADEVLTFDDKLLSQFFKSEYAVASMYMHQHVTPDYVLVHDSGQGRIAVQPVLFDKEQVSAEIHLNYIFLVLPADSLPKPDQKPFPAYPVPVASCSHLTMMRHPRSAVFRGSFYYINWMRANGVSWISNLRGRPLTNSSDLFREVSPEKFRDIMLGEHFVTGVPDPNRKDFAFRHSSTLTPSELSPENKEALKLSFEDYLASLAELNARLVEGRYCRNNIDFMLDATTESSLQPIAPQGTLSLECDEPVAAVEAQIVSLFSHEPWKRSKPLSAATNSSGVEIDLTTLGKLEDSEIRRVISVKIRNASQKPIHRIKLISSAPKDQPVAE